MSSSSVLLPPAHAITPDDHAGYAVIASATCLVFVLLFLIAKLILRWSVLGDIYGDDWTAIAASVTLPNYAHSLHEAISPLIKHRSAASYNADWFSGPSHEGLESQPSYSARSRQL